MHYVMGNTVIARPLDEVFDFVADARNHHLYGATAAAMEKVSADPIGQGSRFAAGDRSRPHGSTLIAYTAYQRQTLLTWVTTVGDVQICRTARFEPGASGTLLRWCSSWRTTGTASALDRLTGAMAMRAARRREPRVWASLKAHLETTTERESAEPVSGGIPAS